MTNSDVFNPYSYAKTNLNHHPYQFTTSSHENLIPQTARSQNTHFTTSQNSSITPNSDTQNNRYKPQSPQSQQQSQQQSTPIALQTPDHNNRQYTSNQQQSSIMAPSLDSPTSPLSSTQCVQNATATTTGTNNVTSLASPISPNIPANIPANLSSSSHNQTVLTSNFDLQEILSQFGTQPDLLKIILTSKVEEDKRRAEEAKLRVREIDMILLDRYKQRRFAEHVEGMDVSNNINNNYEEQLILNNEFDYDIHGNSLGAYLAPDGSSLTYTSFNNSLASSIHNLSIDPSTNAISSSYNNAKCVARIKLSSKSEPTSQEQLTSQNDLSSSNHNQNNNNNNNNNNNSNNNDDAEDCGLNGTPSKRKRKRREMLPVTMIIETRDNPYKDDYLWKNNGNTTQRKTGNKSVYYKCSNSNKGCPVNKTVTEKEDGWMIKYRGHHLEDCGKIKRIVQS